MIKTKIFNFIRVSLKLFLGSLFFFLLTKSAYAAIGVGVGTGKIYVDDKLSPGVIYNLPPLTVFNTGDVATEYEVTTEFRETQEELKPNRGWFSYNPDNFFLEPGGSQVVELKLNIPVSTEPGDYFAFLSAHPNKKSKDGGTTVGVAAAAKLYFTIAPANVFEGIYFRVRSLWIESQPWGNFAVGAIAIFAVIKTIKRFINIDINFSKKKKNIEVREKNEE